MNFWQQLQTAADMERALPWVALAFIVGALVLLTLRPGERTRIRTAILLFAISFIGLLGAASLVSAGVTTSNSSYKWVTWVARLMLWIAVVNVVSVFVFEVFLDALRLKPPRIMRDLLIALTYIVVGITILSRDVDLTGIIATSAVLTAVIGLSFQDTLGNMMGGMALQLERSGEEVKLVALLDAVEPTTRPRPFVVSGRRWQRLRSVLDAPAEDGGLVQATRTVPAESLRDSLKGGNAHVTDESQRLSQEL